MLHRQGAREMLQLGFYLGLFFLLVTTLGIRQRKSLPHVLSMLAISILLLGAYFYTGIQAVRMASIVTDQPAVAERVSIDPDNDGVVEGRLMAAVLYRKEGALDQYRDDAGTVSTFSPSAEELATREEQLALDIQLRFLRDWMAERLWASAGAVLLFAIGGFVLGRPSDA